MADNRYDEAVDITARGLLAEMSHTLIKHAPLGDWTQTTWEDVVLRMSELAPMPDFDAVRAAYDYLTNNPKEKHDD